MPLCDTENPAALEAWFGPGGYDEKLRKILLANCKEIVRARHTVAEAKISETRIDDLAHLHDSYLDFVIGNLNGRRLREEEVKRLAGMGA